MEAKLKRTIKAILAAALVALAACGGKTDESTDREMLANYKQQIAELQAKAGEIEKRLAAETDAQDQGVKVNVTEMQPAAFSHFFKVSAQAEPLQQSYISPELGGQIKAIHVNEGQRVSKGDLLVSINAAPLLGQIAELKTALGLAATVFQRQTALWEQEIGSEIQFLEAKANKEALEKRLAAAQAQLEMSQIRAPFGGIVDRILGKVGELSSPGMELIRLVNMEKMEVSAEVSENYLNVIKPGQNVKIEFPSTGKAIDARISRAGNIINPGNRTFRVVCQLDNRAETIKPNMVAVVEFMDYQNPEALAVPSVIVKTDVQGNSFLFTVDTAENGRPVAQKTIVKPGRTMADKTEILEGLQAGQLVVTDGFNTVSTGAILDINPR
jgi:membrane fusion protein, multidrug efflux system